MKKTKVSPCSDCLTKTDVGNFFASLLVGFVLLVVAGLAMIGVITSLDYLMTPSAAPSPPPAAHAEDHVDYYWAPSWDAADPVIRGPHHHTHSASR